ncbi:MAG: restriction endonuclease [Actinomycetota bacterium]
MRGGEAHPSGSRRFDNRVHWAVTYLVQAGLIHRPKRGVVQITERGREVLAVKPGRIDNDLLDRFPEFVEFKNRTGTRPRAASDAELTSPATAETPTERLSEAVEKANGVVAEELLRRIREREPAFLEDLVLELLTSMGYGGREGAAEHLGQSGDQGLDGVIRQDALGLDRVYVQAKRYAVDSPIGRPEIQAFVGALQGAQADRGIFITTSRFTNDARDYAERVSTRLVLIDGWHLGGLMVRHDIGVQAEETFVLKQIDEDYFEA